ncbi:tetratricopeptide repeat protein [Streptomyces canus]|uniref:tetratricopeptide repeat protein n=1 Tax=Streptomyces canus TaxID=58343 RepID=UPI0033CD12A2
MTTPHPAQPSMWIGPGRDAYTAAHTLHVNNYGNAPTSAGHVSLVPSRLAYPVRGRHSIVACLAAAPPGTVQVLCGAGGSGKTTVALAFAEEARNHGVGVWHVSAADAATFDAHVRALAVQLGVGHERLRLAWSGPEGDAPDLVWRLLDAQDTPWLLIVDNADDLRLLARKDSHVGDGNGWVRPPSRSGRLLITSRNHNPEAWGGWVRLHRLDVLAPEAATELLLDRAPDAGTPAEAAALAGRLGYLPLLLHQAGLYLSRADRNPPWPDKPRCPRTFETYRVALADRLGELLDGCTGQPSYLPHRRATTTWDVTLDLLAEQRLPQARPLLRLLAHFADVPIPYTEVLSRPALHASSLFGLQPDTDLQQVVNALADYGLITTQPPNCGGEDTVSYTATLHPLVAEATRTLDEVYARRGEYVTVAARGLYAAAARRDPRRPADWPFWWLAVSHLHHLLGLARGIDTAHATEALTRTAVACTEYAAEAGRYALAFATTDQASPVAALLPPEHRAVLSLCFERARLTELVGDTAAAEAEYRHLLSTQRRILSDDDPDTLRTRHAIARVLDRRGDLNGAVAECRAVLNGRTHVLGTDHIDTLWTRHNLAWVLAQRGDLEAAETEYQAVLDDRSRTLGTDHPHTLYTRHALAWVLAQRGNLDAAETEYQAVLDDRSRTLGIDHPHTLYTRHALAWVLAQRGDLEAAETEYQATLQGQTRVLGNLHPHTRSTLKALDGLRRRLGTLPPSHPRTRHLDWWDRGGGGS